MNFIGFFSLKTSILHTTSIAYETSFFLIYAETSLEELQQVL